MGTPPPPSSSVIWGSSSQVYARTAASTQDSSACSGCCAVSRRSASIWPRSTCDNTRMFIARCSRRCSATRPGATAPRPTVSRGCGAVAPGRVAEQGEGPAGSPDAQATRTLDVFKAIADCRARFGPDAVGPYIISMTQGADDVLTVLVLARWGGLTANAHVPLDVAPLFETVADLAAAPEVMRELLAEPYYRAHLAERGMHQMVMIGYSDSNKDAGIGASRWALHRAQAVLVDAVGRSGVDLTFFHGRGGTVSRGGGRITSAILSAPAGSVRGRFRMTEQGEAINAKYGLRGIAMRTLEQTVSAVALATALPRPPDSRETGWTGT